MNELIVVTILVAVQGKLKLPKINSREELATALGRLGAIPTDNVRNTLNLFCLGLFILCPLSL